MKTLAVLVFSLSTMWAFTTLPTPNALTLKTHFREASKKSPGSYIARTKTVRWDPRKTAIIICDMWDRHWCQSASNRVAEMAPFMNEVVRNARERGVFVIHAPSDTIDFYRDTPQRELAQSAPAAAAPTDVRTWRSVDPAKEPPLPIDDSDGGCDDEPMCKNYRAWSRQHPAIEIASGDAISDRGDEVYNLLQQRGIENVIIMGVHTNMCVLGRPFSIRRMVGAGKNVVLMRDMTDTMYNPRSKPQVSHFRGTELVVEHIERYWCPSIVSTDLTGKPSFRFRGSGGHAASSAVQDPP
jgi:nicotinamidase-related amidase